MSLVGEAKIANKLLTIHFSLKHLRIPDPETDRLKNEGFFDDVSEKSLLEILLPVFVQQEKRLKDVTLASVRTPLSLSSFL